MGQTREQRVIKQLTNVPSVQKFTAIATDMYLPNHSGLTSHPEFKNNKRCWEVNLLNPNGIYGLDTQVPVAYTNKAITITKIVVSLNTAAKEIAGDLKYADDLTAFTNAAVINDFDTTNGVRTDTSISSGNVAAGKYIYLQFDSQPDSAITFALIHIEWVVA